MGSPFIFKGQRPKALTAKGPLLASGESLDYNGSVNYVLNPRFETGTTTGWSLFNTTLTSLVPTGAITAGAASITTFATTTSNVLNGSYSLNTAIASGTITAGHGFITDALTIANEHKASVLSFSCSYSVITGPTLLNASGTSANTFHFYIYDVTNSAWIQPTSCYGMVQLTGTGRVTGTFQTTSNSTQYRLAVICINPNTAGAVSILWDSFTLGPQVVQKGPAMSDRVAYTPTLSASFGTTSNVSFTYKRVGDELFVDGSFTSGTTTAAPGSISLPSGMVLDTTKLSITGNTTAAAGQEIGAWYNSQAASNTSAVVTAPGTSTSLVYLATNSNSSGMLIAGNLSGFMTGGGVVSVNFKVPISGWSSNSVMSSDTDTRVVDFVGYKSAGQAITANTTDITYTALKDSHGAWSGSAYIVPVSGDYYVNVTGSATGATVIGVWVGGTQVKLLGDQSSAANTSVSGIIYGLKAGDSLTIRGSVSVTINGTASTNSVYNLFINRLSGPAVVAASESISCSYWCSANFTASTTTPINFDSKEWDSHNAVNISASAWRFTAPISGVYDVSGLVDNNVTNITVMVYKNGTIYKSVGTDNTSAPGTIAGKIRLLAGDYIDFRPNASVTFAGGTLATPAVATIAIVRVGNY